jgi:hypothetical protein
MPPAVRFLAATRYLLLALAKAFTPMRLAAAMLIVSA